MSKEVETKEGVSAKSALIVELDDVALGARRIRYDVLTGIFKEQKIEFTPVMFSRYCLKASPTLYMPALLAAMKYTVATPEQVTERLLGETTSQLMQKDVQVNPGLVKWLNVAKQRGAAIGAVSMLPQATADAVADHAGFTQWNTKVYAPSAPEKDFPNVDQWGRMVQGLGRVPRSSLAIVSSMAFAKSALAAGLTVAVVTDEFTEFQDFGGASLVTADLSEVKPDAFFDEISF